ncbi:hypothetical protein LguiA_020238 [Lonicera macranthoides]
MEGRSVRAFKGLRGYRKRRGYERLGGRGKNHVEFGGSTLRRRFYLRIKKLKLKLRFSPKKFFVRIRDGYVNMMVRLASSRVMVGVGGDGFGGFGSRPLKEYDEKMIVEVYKSLVMVQDQLVHRDAGELGSGALCRR